MIVGELRHGQLAIIDRIRETVRLSEGLSVNGTLTEPAKRRALECLSRFGERLRDMQASSVRTAGTSTLRRASDSNAFRKEAEKALGFPIDVISGIEEARLIYIGVTQSLPPADGLRLVLDIGGGSTELILGRAAKPSALESLNMGCVFMTEKYFTDGELNERNFSAARLAARLKLRPIKAFFRDTLEIEAIGTSGTIISTEAVARELGIIESNDLLPGVVEKLIEQVLEFDTIADLSLPGLSDRRAQVWPGGLAILVELMDVLRIDRLRISDGALREGLLYDHLGRLQHEDARERSVQALATRYNVDNAQAARVGGTAARLLEQCIEPWRFDTLPASMVLQWGARLHEIGLDISHNGFQKHGAYIVENADLPGFPRSEQMFLAFLIAAQRQRIDQSKLEQLPAALQMPVLRLAILLRLAVLLNRSRSSLELPDIEIAVGESSIRLSFPQGWLDDNPLTITDLDREKNYLGQVGCDLTYC